VFCGIGLASLGASPQNASSVAIHSYSTELTSGPALRAGMGVVASAEPNELESVTGRILTSVSARRRACDAIYSLGGCCRPVRIDIDVWLGPAHIFRKCVR